MTTVLNNAKFIIEPITQAFSQKKEEDRNTRLRHIVLCINWVEER